MPKPQWTFKKIANLDSLSFRLLSYILLCSSVLAIAITSLQLLWDYRQDVVQIEDSIEQIEASFLESIATSYWNLDQAQVEVQLDGIMRLPNMQYVVVKEILGDALVPLIERGGAQPQYDISREFELVYQDQLVGKLFVAASLEEVYHRLIEKSLIILISQAIKTFVVSVCILWLIYMLVIRHIHKLVNYTNHLDLTRDSPPLVFDGRRNVKRSSDELDVLADTVNKMRMKMIDELEERQRSRVQLEQERDFSATIIRSSTSVICCLHEDMSIYSINPSGELLTGIDHQALIGQSWPKLFTKDNKSPFASVSGNSEHVEEVSGLEVVMHNQEGESRTLTWNFVPFFNQGVLEYYIAFGHDVTDWKNIQLEIENLNQELEQKVNDRTASLESSNSRLTQAFSELKQTQDILIESEKMASLGELVAGVAHEVNTPIGVCVTAASFLQEQTIDFEKSFKAENISEQDVESFLECLNDSSEILINSLTRASELIKSFKQVAVDQSSEANYNFFMAENLSQVISSLHHKLKKADAEVIVSCSDTLAITSYPGSFVQIYTNLILNSITHGFDQWEGEREIYITVERIGDNVHIEYRDSGKGIEKDIAARIFDPFVTSKRGLGGSGLGTHVVYNVVVQLLKGKIYCDKEVEHGVRFVIELPYTA
ncbi:ATP-binding protein [Vibrio profundum]|uniref:ATP-binding protein n=1 Tax=Vibrio profundum TaxID=2910247 RepID=UPI003D0D8C4D